MQTGHQSRRGSSMTLLAHLHVVHLVLDAVFVSARTQSRGDTLGTAGTVEHSALDAQATTALDAIPPSDGDHSLTPMTIARNALN
jgi:hypothetical protein